MRVVILGNAGSGKSTLTSWLAQEGSAERLDLDTVAWEPGQVAVPRDPATAQSEVERCLANCRSRPWEPHKYASPAEQDERRPGELGREDHRACFLAYGGPRTHLRDTPVRDALSPELLC